MEKVLTKKSGKTAANNKKKTILTRFEITDFLLSFAAFFIGRVIVFGDVSPLTAAYISLFIGRGNKLYIAAFFAVVGILTKLSFAGMSKYLICVVLLGVVHFFIKEFKLALTDLSRAIICSVTVAVSGLAVAFINGSYVYLSLMSVLESVLSFSLCLIMSKGFALTHMHTVARRFSGEELISVVLLACGFVTGMADIYIGEFALRYCFSAFAIIMFAYKGGATVGATAGLVLGVMLYMAGYESLEYVVAMSVSGFFAGTLHDLRRFFSAIAFIVTSVLTGFFLSGRLADIGYLLSVLFAGTLFMLIPTKVFDILGETLRPTVASAADYSEKVKEIVIYKLDSVSKAFEKLAKNISLLTEKQDAGQKEADKLVKDIIADSCETCGNRDVCWEDNYYNTYRAFLGMIAACEKTGRLSAEDIGLSMRENCIALKEVCASVADNYLLYKSMRMVSVRAEENRELVSRQLMSVSGMLTKLSKDLDIRASFDEEAEKIFLNELLSHRIEVHSLGISLDGEGKYEVNLTHKPCREGHSCHKKIALIASRVLDRHMKYDVKECTPRRHGGNSVCAVKLTEEQELKVVYGVAAITKDSERESGDSFTYTETEDGCLIALSDGMGSGKAARKESETTVTLLESFSEAGFDEEKSIKLINSVLLMKSTEDLFSTLDLCKIDLYRREAKFIKIGAAPSFILRDGELSMIKSYTLPVGVLSDIEIEPIKKTLRSGDVIVMATDGLTDLDISSAEGESWLADLIRKAGDGSPKDIANYLITEAKQKSDNLILDDITVLVARLY